MKLPKILARWYMDVELLEWLDEKRKEKKLKSLGETARVYLGLARFVEGIKEEAKDPDFVKKIKEFTLDEKIFEWTETFTPDELNIIKQAVNVTLDKKYKQKRLV